MCSIQSYDGQCESNTFNLLSSAPWKLVTMLLRTTLRRPGAVLVSPVHCKCPSNAKMLVRISHLLLPSPSCVHRNYSYNVQSLDGDFKRHLLEKGLLFSICECNLSEARDAIIDDLHCSLSIAHFFKEIGTPSDLSAPFNAFDQLHDRQYCCP